MEDQEGVRAVHRAASRGKREQHDGTKPEAEQAFCSARDTHKRGVRHHEHDQAQVPVLPGNRAGQPRSKRKASEGEDDDRGPEPDQSRNSQPKEENEEKKQRVIDGRKAALEFLDSMEKCMKDNGICAKCANSAHDGDCKKVEEAAGNEKAMEKIRELLSSDHVSSDEEMGDADKPSSSTSREHRAGEQKGKEIIEMYSYTINLVETADTAEGGELHCGGVDLTFNPCGDHRTFKTTLERGCDTIPCYIPRFGDVSDVDMPWAYASMTDPKFFPKGAILEQIDVQQLGKSINFCIYPFGDVPFCKIGDEHSVFGSRDQATLQNPPTQDRQLLRKCFQV